MNRRNFLLSSSIPLLAQTPGPPVHSFSGSFHQIGKQHGLALKKEIRAEADPSLQQLCTAWKMDVQKTLAKVQDRHEGVFRELVPHSIEEMQGIADGSGLPYPYVFFAGIRDLLPAQEGCTAVVCPGKFTTTGKPIIGQTKDTSAPLSRYHLFLTKETSGFRAISLAYPGWIGNISLNSHGVSWTGNSLYGPEPRGRLHPASLLKRLLYEAKDVRQVLQMIRGLRFGNGCFCAADQSGTAVSMEWIDGECDLIEITERYGHANNILGRRRKREFSLASNANSALRQSRINFLLKTQTKPVTPSDFEKWFVDHQHYPRSICRHTSLENTDVTTAAFIADLGPLEMRVALGNPCESTFLTHRIKEV